MPAQPDEPTSIFLWPTSYPADGAPSVQVRLNQELVRAYALRPAAANAAPLEEICLTRECVRGAADTPAETARKLTAMLAALATTALGALAPAITPSTVMPGGLSQRDAERTNNFLLRLAGLPLPVSTGGNYMDFSRADASGLLAILLEEMGEYIPEVVVPVEEDNTGLLVAVVLEDA